MLNADLVKYINEQKRPFNKGQLFDIGVKHKNLKEGKNWAELVDLLGLKIHGDSFRKWINNQLKNAPAADISKDDSVESFEEIYKEKTKIRDAWNAYRSSLREGARLESFYKEMAEAIKTLPSINICSSYASKLWSEEDDSSASIGSEREAVLLLSDLHIGVKCSNFYNKYDSSVAQARLEMLVEDVIRYCNLHKVNKLNILNLGDAIHGAIHTNARLQQEFDVIKQVTTASELIAQTLECLQFAAPEVTYRSVIDNHSRLISNKEDSIDAENLSKLIDFYLETRLTGSNVKFIHDNLDEGLGMFQLDNGKKFAFSHGHNESVNAVLQNICGATQSFVDYFAMGHLHSNKLKEFQGMSLFINGSICGTEQYALGKRLFNKASQRLLIFDYSDNVVDIKINLQPDLHFKNKKFD